MLRKGTYRGQRNQIPAPLVPCFTAHNSHAFGGIHGNSLIFSGKMDRMRVLSLEKVLLGDRLLGNEIRDQIWILMEEYGNHPLHTDM
jgi:hypothetical protein